MSFSEDPLVGKFVWHDLITEDIDAARRFYGGVLGWTFEDSGTRDGYVVARSGDVYVAGMVPVTEPADGSNLSRWVPYVSVADVDDAISRSGVRDGKVAVTARDVPLGRVAALIDPEGAVYGVARSSIGDPTDATTAAAPGRVVWSELLAADPDKAAAYYEGVVGYSIENSARSGGTYTFLRQGDVKRAGILLNPMSGWESQWITYFGVDDPVAATERVERFGGRVVVPVSPDVREGTVAVVTDPSGAILALRRATD
jgi:uncharacterized protein